jgi:integrase
VTVATYRRRNDRWQVQVRRAGGAARSRTFDTKAAAERWARGVEREIDELRSGRHAEAGTVDQLIRRYAAEVGRHKPFGRSKAAAIETLRAGLGHLKVSRLTPEAIVAFAMARHAAGAGPVTVGIDLAYLGTVLRTARALWRLQVSDEPVRQAREGLAILGLVGRSRARDRRPTQAEIDALCAHFRGNPRQAIPMADIVELAVATGMRREELCSIRWADLDEAAAIVTIRNRKHPREKRGNDERVPLLAATGYDALAIILRQPKVAARIFPVLPGSVTRAWNRACTTLGIVGLTFHDLRHEAVSRLFEAGLPIEHVALVSGHRDWRTLRRYTQLRPETVIRHASRSRPPSA